MPTTVTGPRVPAGAVAAVGAAGALGVAALGWAAGVEMRRFTLRESTVPVLAPGAAPLRVLHVSDTHLTPRDRSRAAWVRDLATLRPDLVVDTGDTLAHQEAVGPALAMLEPLLALPGAFVLGSNDYYAPRPKNPARYLLPDRGKRIHGEQLPWRELRDALRAAGWADLTNAEAAVPVGDRVVAARGVDDPHIARDDYAAVAGPADPLADLRLGVSHSPEPRVLERFAADGFDLVLCGHTHGGQLRLPGVGALVTNCGLDRGRARGLSRFDGTWLHVSAGLGTSPYTPVRFACPPEASLLTLVAAPAG